MEKVSVIEKNNHYQLLKWFCMVAVIEAISYLLLLGFGMPMKYMMDQPIWVKIFGNIHGVLVFVFIALLIMCWRKYKWTYERVLLLFIGSLLPIVPFIYERKLKKEAGI
jgi:integral membrane protein